MGFAGTVPVETDSQGRDSDRLKRSSGALFRLVVLVEVLTGNLLLGHVGEFKDEIDDLVLINRRAKLGERIGIVAIIIPNLFLASRHRARALDHRAADLVVGNGDLVLLANLREHEAEAD